jgi:2-succinyl-5-enolpyruvyl-6-hydroxy-3-cyclohexene-1-carboxylate synthase
MHHLQHIAALAPVLERMGARQVVIAPGSRNAPLIQLFTSHIGFSCHSIVDERSAGYVALGMARQTGKPVIIVCTSGTAVLNLSPAVAEAFHQNLPLVVLTADRPREKIPLFNNQVIDQRAPFFNYSMGFFEFPAQVRTEEELQSGLRAVEVLLTEAISGTQGPVHVNLPLCEPLYLTLPEAVTGPAKDEGNSIIRAEKHSIPKTDLSGQKVLILAGMGKGSEEILLNLEQIMDRGQVAVVAENISNLHSELFVSVPELVLAADPDELKELVPDMVITFGQQMVSKRMKLFVNSLEEVEIRMIPEGASVLGWLKAMEGDPDPGVENLFGSSWKALEKRECMRASSYLEAASHSNLVVTKRILDRAPAGTVIHLGNSATIRNSHMIPMLCGTRIFLII